jgi:hypothetical protein
LVVDSLDQICSGGREESVPMGLSGGTEGGLQAFSGSLRQSVRYATEDKAVVADLVVFAFGDDDVIPSKESDELALSTWLLVEVCVLLQKLYKSFGVGDMEALVVEDAKVADQAVIGHLIGPSEEVGCIGLSQQSLPDCALVGCRQMAVWTEEGINKCLVHAVRNPEGDGGACGQEYVCHSDRLIDVN